VTRDGVLRERVRSRVAEVPPYVPGLGGAQGHGKLSSNEAPFGASPRVRQALRALPDVVHRYDSGLRTRELLAAALGVSAAEVLLTNGSDELCYLIGLLLLDGGGRSVVLSEPSYAIDTKVSAIFGARARFVPLRDGGHDLPRLAAAAADADLVWLPTPHNPTGVAVPPADLVAFVEAVPPDCLVVVDEAYRAFLSPDLVPDTVALVRRHPNVLVQRTFSKDHALAGLRAGYGVASAEVVSALDALRGPFNVNAAALVAVEASLDSEAWRALGVDLVQRERRLLEEFLSTQDIAYYPSQANFVAVRVPYAEIAEALGRAGLFVRPGEDLGLPGWCRLSIGEPAHMAALRRVLAGWRAADGR